MHGATGDAWARLPGSSGDAWERLIWSGGSTVYLYPEADLIFYADIVLEGWEAAVTDVYLYGKIVLEIGKTYQFTYATEPPDAPNQKVYWDSTNTGVATVSSGGLVTPLSEGNTTISIITQDGDYTDYRDIIIVSEIKRWNLFRAFFKGFIKILMDDRDRG
jgi:hypothetical protein